MHVCVARFNWNRTNSHLIDVIERLHAAGENVMHVRYEAMIADPKRFARDITTFLPQLGELDVNRNGMAETDVGDVEGNRAQVWSSRSSTQKKKKRNKRRR